MLNLLRNMSLIIAEAGVNHNGSEDIAFDLIDVASSLLELTS